MDQETGSAAGLIVAVLFLILVIGLGAGAWGVVSYRIQMLQAVEAQMRAEQAEAQAIAAREKLEQISADEEFDPILDD